MTALFLAGFPSAIFVVMAGHGRLQPG